MRILALSLLFISGCAGKPSAKEANSKLGTSAKQGDLYVGLLTSLEACVEYSEEPGQCKVTTKNNGEITNSIGTCSFEVGSLSNSYVELRCVSASGEGCDKSSEIIVNLNTPKEIEGDETKLVDKTSSDRFIEFKQRGYCKKTFLAGANSSGSSRYDDSSGNGNGGSSGGISSAYEATFEGRYLKGIMGCMQFSSKPGACRFNFDNTLPRKGDCAVSISQIGTMTTMKVTVTNGSYEHSGFGAGPFDLKNPLPSPSASTFPMIGKNGQKLEGFKVTSTSCL